MTLFAIQFQTRGMLYIGHGYLIILTQSDFIEFTMVIQNLKKHKTSAQHYSCALVQNFEMFPGVFQNGRTLFNLFF